MFTADSLGVSFRDREVLKAATVWAEAGQVTVLLGRNGCGKTTLIRSALGQCRLDYGVVRFADQVYERPRLPTLARRGLFYLPDRGLLSWRRTVDWHIRAMSQSVRHPLDLESIAWLDIEPLRRKTAKKMSGGERRRVEVGLALLRRPYCLLADEPLAEVSPADRQRVAQGIRELAGHGCAVLVTGHEVDDLLDLADIVVWMVGGTTHWLGTPAQARSHAQFRLDYLGPEGDSAGSGGIHLT
jgi:ABC-type multidrug transport system ATPase subunit